MHGITIVYNILLYVVLLIVAKVRIYNVYMCMVLKEHILLLYY